MNENDRIFQEFWQTYQWPDPKPVLFRLYHDDDGRPLIYTQQDLPGKYIDITPEQYRLADMRVRVKQGQICRLPCHAVDKLVPNGRGTACHPHDVTLVVPEEPYQKWSIRNVQDH